MNKDEFNSLQIGTRVKVMRGLSAPPNRGIWEHYMSLKVEDKK